MLTLLASSRATRGLLPILALGFLTLLMVPVRPPALFGPDAFSLASWCLAFAAPVLSVALIKGGLRRLGVAGPALAYLGWAAVTTAWSFDAANSLANLAMLGAIVAAAIGIAWVVSVHAQREHVALGWLFALLMTVQCVAFLYHVEAGLTQRIGLYLVPSAWGGYPELGLLVGLQFAIVLAALVTTTDPRARAACLVLVALSVVEAAFLFARAAWVSMAAVAVALPALSGHRRSTIRWVGVTVVASLIVAGAAAALNPSLRTIGAGVLSGRFGGGGTVEGVTLNVATPDMRTAIWRRTTELIRDHPFVGVGLGNFQQVYEPNYNPETNNDGRRGVHAHNAFLQQAGELGVPGGVLYALVWVTALRHGWRRARRTHSFVAVATVGCVVVMLVQSMTDVFSFTYGGARGRLTLLIWMMLALASVRGPAPEARTAPGGTPKGLASEQ